MACDGVPSHEVAVKECILTSAVAAMEGSVGVSAVSSVKDRRADAENFSKFRAEASLLGRLQRAGQFHRHIVHCWGVVVEPKVSAGLVFSYCSGGTLYDWLRRPLSTQHQR
eukprot:SAG31_NODE_828_length_11716_cov_4.405785_7_plen_111_part_00